MWDLFLIETLYIWQDVYKIQDVGGHHLSKLRSSTIWSPFSFPGLTISFSFGIEPAPPWIFLDICKHYNWIITCISWRSRLYVEFSFKTGCRLKAQQTPTSVMTLLWVNMNPHSNIVTGLKRSWHSTMIPFHIMVCNRLRENFYSKYYCSWWYIEEHKERGKKSFALIVIYSYLKVNWCFFC